MSACLNCSWLKELYLSPDKSDVTVLVQKDKNTAEKGQEPPCEKQDAIFRAHSLVLRCQSPVFDAMLEENKFTESQTKTIKLVGFSTRAVEYFLRYLYTKFLPEIIPFHTLQEIMGIAHQYDVKKLFTECCTKLGAAVTVSTACSLYQAAVSMKADSLLKICETKINQNLTAILENDLFFGMDNDSIYGFPCSDSSLAIRNAYRRIANYSYYVGVSSSKDAEVAPCYTLEAPESPYADQAKHRCFATDLYMNRTLSDVELVVTDGYQEARFPAHSVVLASQSERFMKIFSEEEEKVKAKRKIKALNLEDVSPRIGEYFLRFLYTQMLVKEVCEAHLMDILELAHEYNVKSLEEECEKRLVAGMNQVNICDLLSFSSRLELKNLRDTCLLKISILSAETIVKNNLHFSLNVQEMRDFTSRSSWATLKDTTNRPEVLRDWSKWRLSLQGRETTLEEVDAFSLTTI